MGFNATYPLEMTDIAMENPRTEWRTEWRFIARKIIDKYGPFSIPCLITGNDSHAYGKSQCSMGKLTRAGPFSTVLLNFQKGTSRLQ